MLCLDIYVNKARVASAGGKNAVALSAELSGGRDGPIGLNVRGLSSENHGLVWTDMTIESSSVVEFRVREENFAEGIPQRTKQVQPSVRRRNELRMLIAENGRFCCTAEIGDKEFVGIHLRWNEQEKAFLVEALSATPSEEGYAKKTVWWSAMLLVDDYVSFHIKSENEIIE
ncbi:MAG: hypothetical protein OEY67_02755 [Gammaproteobacteria bacterium]|nr:hypothetical protein [Gammaproteobacteria bacterium]